MEKNKCERSDLSGADGCESGHEWAVPASNDYWNKSLEDWRQSKVGIIKCNSPENKINQKELQVIICMLSLVNQQTTLKNLW